MMFKRGTFLIIFLAFLLAPGCQQRQEDNDQTKTKGDKKSLVRVNKYMIEKDREIIENYIKRREWKMEMTASGLWYMIYENGAGEEVEEGSLVTMHYTLHLLDGTLCYDSDETGPKHFVVGRGGAEPGLDEGIRFLKMGDKARFILPPHLAYGLMGDENKIPARSVIVYDLEVVSVQN